jgi:nucleotide-binding universal stress UspA family protein
MSDKIIVSYDGTDNDTDALALGRMLEPAGVSLDLAYVRHSTEPDARGEAAARKESEELLETGAQWLGRPDIPRHVVFSISTPEGLRQLALSQEADLIVFGSEYRTTPGYVFPGTSAQRLLEGGPLSIALAPAGLRDRPDAKIETIAAVNDEGDASATETAEGLAAALGARLASKPGEPADLIVVGSRRGVPSGRVTVSAAAQYLIETIRMPVIVVPRGRALRLGK